MDSSSWIMLIILIILVLLSAFFSSAETALVTVNKLRIKTLADEGNKRAITLLKITENSGKMLSAILIGNNLVNISASSLATVFAQNQFGNYAVSIATGILTLVVLLFGEITPKTLATIYSEPLAKFYAPIIWGLMCILTPVIFIVNKLSAFIMFVMHVDPNKKGNTYTETELRTIVDVSHEEGVIETEEREMIKNVFDFGDALAKDIMIPRIDMCMIDINSTYDELMETFRQTKYTRFPVYSENTDNIIGMINIKDILLFDKAKDLFQMKNFLRKAHFTYEFKSLSELMIEMKKDSINIIIVLDEYGATAGLITLEDMIEEIVGEIRDEYDYDEEDEIKEINEFEYIVDGQTKLDDLNEHLPTPLTSEDYDSVSGFIIDKLDRLADIGDEVIHENIRLVVETMGKNRIEKVHVYISPESEEDDK
ncbi:MAG: HlyC/CorC family transporter [Lachnospiraceae bacterium]|nr:HlyC/CorC family transporter [Lachnospiraceae bacterium]